MDLTKKLTSNDFQVALLMENIGEAKLLTDVLRQVGIYAHFYQNLDEYWVDANTKTPNLTIVDVKKMSDGELLFENHPKVKSGHICFSFFYSEESKFLLNSTYNLNHHGYLKKEISLNGQLMSILRRRNNELHLLDQNVDLVKKIDRVQKRIQVISDKANKAHEFEHQFNLMDTFFKKFGSSKDTNSFYKNLTSAMNEWDPCLSFGVYKISKNAQKLTSLNPDGPKFKAFPDLWLTKASENGISGYAREMAEDVSSDYLLNTARSVEIKGRFSNGDALIIGNFDEIKLTAFDWNIFGERLSNLYRAAIIQEMNTDQSTNDLTSFEAFSLLDDIYFHQAHSNYKVLCLDLSNLLSLLKEQHGNRFYWKTFYSDFKDELCQGLSGDYKYSAYGAQSILLFLDKKHLDHDFQILKHMISDFSYFKYFEDSTIIMKERNKPELSPLTPSSVNFLRQLETREVLKNDILKNNKRRSTNSPNFNL
jgi:hypothetical protein